MNLGSDGKPHVAKTVHVVDFIGEGQLEWVREVCEDAAKLCMRAIGRRCIGHGELRRLIEVSDGEREGRKRRLMVAWPR